MQEIIFIIVGIVIIVAWTIYVFFSPSEAESRGKRGEEIVASILMQLPYEYYLWNDIIIQRDGYSVQIDHLVISEYGIFVIETKNYTGWILGGENSEYWTKSMFGYRYKFNNPIKQNHSHVKALSKLFKVPESFFIPIVVFLSGAELKCRTKSTVTYEYYLLNEIYKHKTPIITLSQIQQFAIVLNAAIIEMDDTRKEHLQKVYERIWKKQNSKDLGNCPRCGSKLVERAGKYGSFIGCSNYPKCKFTANC